MKRKTKPKAKADLFENVARDRGADESGSIFERTFRAIVPPKKPKKKKRL